MRTRKEDDLIRLAFKEIAQESKAVEKPKEADLLHEYEALRFDLQKARDIPEHQLSNDRLREAILRKGLKPAQAPAKTESGWIWNASAACAVVALLTVAFLRHKPSGEPVINMPDANVVARNDIHFDDHAFQISNDPSIPLMKAAEFRIQPARKHHHRSSHHTLEAVKQSSATLDPNWLASDQNLEGEYVSPTPTSVDMNSNPPSGAAKPPTASAQSKAPPAKPDSGDLVEIELNKDNQTGARAAREIEGSSLIVRG